VVMVDEEEEGAGMVVEEVEEGTEDEEGGLMRGGGSAGRLGLRTDCDRSKTRFDRSGRGEGGRCSGSSRR
jgi:hypothetical protein